MRGVTQDSENKAQSPAASTGSAAARARGNPVRASAMAQSAAALGFDLCGIARAEPLDPARFDRWLERGWDGPSISYVRERRAERLDPSLLLPGARAVIAVAASYAPDLPEPAAGGELRVARYAQGRDYHNVVLKPVRQLAAGIRA